MFTRADFHEQAARSTMDATIASARASFVCLFSSSDEYEQALISERRAQGHYGRRLPLSGFVALTLIVACVAILLT